MQNKFNIIKKECGVYFRKNGDIIIHSWSRDIAGVGFISPPFIKRKTSDDSIIIGQSVLDALMEENSPFPEKPSEILYPLFELTDTKTWSGFIKSSNYLEVIYFNGKLTFNPMKDMGSKEGFIPLSSKFELIKDIKDVSATEMGNLILDCKKLF